MADGAIVAGGSVSVTGPGTVVVKMDGSSGQYSFETDGAVGTYTLAIVPPPGYLIDPSRPPADTVFDSGGGSSAITLGSGESPLSQGYLAHSAATNNPYYFAIVLGTNRNVVLNNNFPLMRPNRVGDRVWHDLDADGIQDANEKGVSNVVVRLLDQDQNTVTSVVTDVHGYYAFDNPGTAERLIQVIPPSNYVFTTQDAPTWETGRGNRKAQSDGRSARWKRARKLA